MPLDKEYNFFYLLNNLEKEFICEWGMKSVKFSRGDSLPCITIWINCFITDCGRIRMGKKDTPGQYDTIKIDDSDGKIIISIQSGSSFNYFAELVS